MAPKSLKSRGKEKESGCLNRRSRKEGHRRGRETQGKKAEQDGDSAGKKGHGK
jgi:hypothetical protein